MLGIICDFYIISGYTSITKKNLRSSGCIFLGVKIHQKPRFVQSKHFHYTCLNTTVSDAPHDQRVQFQILLYFCNLHIMTFNLMCHLLCFNEKKFPDIGVYLVQLHYSKLAL